MPVRSTRSVLKTHMFSLFICIGPDHMPNKNMKATTSASSILIMLHALTFRPAAQGKVCIRTKHVADFGLYSPGRNMCRFWDKTKQKTTQHTSCRAGLLPPLPHHPQYHTRTHIVVSGSFQMLWKNKTSGKKVFAEAPSVRCTVGTRFKSPQEHASVAALHLRAALI